MNRVSMAVHLAGVILGGFLGWLYYYKVGCVTGHCAIWANPWRAIGFGGLLGFVVAGFIPFKKTPRSNPDSESAES
ncbi:MAG TPA: hypothetical protein ENH10_10265 [Bacteroidetes bacterium]|nr:hypothetical protein BMS3Bbin04_01437 [bacterium BMS3Bbin04]HDO66390.1 hypothetical protein [Bacteroidota bacterium]HEX05515.1 hypothetical protein [Bacteroidota bacterium]